MAMRRIINNYSEYFGIMMTITTRQHQHQSQVLENRIEEKIELIMWRTFVGDLCAVGIENPQEKNVGLQPKWRMTITSNVTICAMN